jgi:protein-tyrosine phosphatase
LFRAVKLPQGIKGRLYLHSMPGRYENVDAVWAEIARLKVSALVRLAPMDEIREKSSRYAEALDRGAVPYSVLSCPICDYRGPDDDAIFIEVVERVSTLLRRGEGVLAHCAGGVGRTGLFAVATLVALGMTESDAREHVTAAGSGPERPVQDEALRRMGPRLARSSNE